MSIFFWPVPPKLQYRRLGLPAEGEGGTVANKGEK